MSFVTKGTDPATEEQDHADDSPDVTCDCGNQSFTLRYGFYEVKARCTKCQREEAVYDG